MLTSKAPFAIITNRARRLLDRIETRIRTGQISNRVQFLTEILEGIARFTRGLREPSMEVTRMQQDDLLIREYITEPIAEANEDIQLAYDQIQVLRDLTRQVFNVSQAERAGLGENLAEVTAELDRLRLWVSDSDPAFVWAGDTFNHTNKVEQSSTVFVDTSAGTVTLKPVSSRSLSDKIASARIDRKLSEGGLPGNAAEIRLPGRAAFTGEDPEPLPVLFGDGKPRKDALPSIFDGNPDTWFEWERVYLDPTQPIVQVGQAYVTDPSGKTTYKTKKKKLFGIITIGKKKVGLQIPLLENWSCYIRWPGDFKLDTGVATKGYPLAYFQDSDRRDLRLAIEISLDQPRRAAWLQLTPLIKGNTYPEVEQILISADGVLFKSILSRPTVLHPRMNRGIDFAEYGASASNFEGVGVWPLPNSAIKHIKIVIKQAGIYETPLGIGHRFFMNAKRKRVQGPVPVVGSFAATLSDNQEDLDFAANEVETATQLAQGFDVLKAFRQCIAIRDLLLEERTYAESGQLVAVPHLTDRPVRNIALLTTEQIPDSWTETREDGSHWITYEVSPDGNVWFPIVPQVTQLEDSVVKFDTPTNTVHFRATLSRPGDDEGGTPILQAYALKMLP